MFNNYCVERKTNDKIAVYHSLYFDPVFLPIPEWNQIKQGLITEEQKKILAKHHLLDSEQEDAERWQQILDAEKFCAGNVDVLYLILTKNCNLRCSYCMVQNGGYQKQTMDYETAQRAIDLFCHSLVDRNLSSGKIHLYGGEPLICRDLLRKVIQYIRKQDIRLQISLVTNGTLLTEEICMFLIQNQVSLSISIDGPEFLCDRHRRYADGKTGVYRDIIQKIHFLQAQKYIHGISLCMSPELSRHREDIQNWLLEEQIHNIGINLFHYVYYEPNWRKKAEEQADTLMDLYTFFLQHGIHESRLMRRINAVQLGEPILADCAARGGNQISIFPDGHIGICHVERSKNASRLVSCIQSFDELWEDPDHLFWKDLSLADCKECQTCEAFFLCGAGCRVQQHILRCPDKDESFCIYVKKLTDWFLQHMEVKIPA